MGVVRGAGCGVVCGRPLKSPKGRGLELGDQTGRLAEPRVWGMHALCSFGLWSLVATAVRRRRGPVRCQRTASRM